MARISPEHVGEKRLMALAGVVEPHNYRGQDAHVVAEAADLRDQALVLLCDEAQAGLGHS